MFCGTGNIQVCENCFLQIPKKINFENNILSLYSFKEEKINQMLWQLKYHHTGDIAKVFGNALASELIPHLSDDKIYLIPIPLSLGDRRLHNHAELIANSISENLNRNNLNTEVIPNLLIKNSKVKQVNTKSKSERIENIKGKFTLNKKYVQVKNKNIYILVDDVTTSGSTLNEARKVLAESFQISKEEILAITVAH